MSPKARGPDVVASPSIRPANVFVGPLPHDAASLADGQPYARATLHFRVEDVAGSIEARPRVQHHDDMLIISRPRLDLVEIVLVRVVRIVRLLFGPIAHESGRTVPALS